MISRLHKKSQNARKKNLCLMAGGPLLSLAIGRLYREPVFSGPFYNDNNISPFLPRLSLRFFGCVISLSDVLSVDKYLQYSRHY